MVCLRGAAENEVDELFPADAARQLSAAPGLVVTADQ
jgi:hypothetical protein